jgi:ABC transporter substrate binding protein
MRRIRFVVGWILLLAASGASAAEVAILKSTDNPAWKPALDALRGSLRAHMFAEYDFQGDRGEGIRILEKLKGRPVFLVALGPLAAQLVREVTPDLPLVFGMVAERVVRIGLQVRVLESDQDVQPALRGLLSGPDAVDALWLPADPLLLGDETRRLLLTEAAKAGKPVYAFSAGLVAEGALVSNGPDFASIGEMAAELVNRLAAGEEEPIGMLMPRAELIINTKAATKLKIRIPPDALAMASKTF